MTSQRAGLKQLVSGSAVVLSFKILGAMGGLGFAYFTVLWSGAASYGNAELFLTVVTIVAVLGRLGLDGAVVRFFAAYQSENRWAAIREALRWSMVRVLLASVLLSVVVQLSCELWGRTYTGEFHEAMRWFVPAAVMYAMAGFAAEALRGLGRMLPYAILQQGPMLAAAAAVFVFTLDAPWALALAAIAWGVVGVVWLAIVLANSPRPPASLRTQDPSQVPTQVHSEIWAVAKPMWWSGALYLVMSWTDTLMVGHFMTSTDLGVYRFVFRFAALITFSQFAINAIAAPTFSALHAQNDGSEMKRSVRRIGWLNMAFATPVFGCLLLAAPWVTQFFGPEFTTTEALTALLILAAAQWINALCGPVLYLLNMTGRERVALKILAGSAVLNVALNLWLIPLLGLVGAACATAVGTVVWNTFAVVYIWRADGLVMIPLLEVCRKN